MVKLKVSTYLPSVFHVFGAHRYHLQCPVKLHTQDHEPKEGKLYQAIPALKEVDCRYIITKVFELILIKDNKYLNMARTQIEHIDPLDLH